MPVLQARKRRRIGQGRGSKGILLGGVRYVRDRVTGALRVHRQQSYRHPSSSSSSDSDSSESSTTLWSADDQQPGGQVVEEAADDPYCAEGSSDEDQDVVNPYLDPDPTDIVPQFPEDGFQANGNGLPDPNALGVYMPEDEQVCLHLY